MVAVPSVQETAQESSSWRYVRRFVLGGAVLESDTGRVRCHTPVQLVSVATGETRLVPCERYCEACDRRRKAQQSDLIQTGLQLSGSPFRYLLTLTAPGRSVDLSEWNPEAGAIWNRARLALDRLLPGFEFYRCAEVQDRGAIHHHVIIGSAVPLTKRQARRIAKSAGYGWIDLRPIPMTDERKVARYLAKYLVKSSGERRKVIWPADRPNNWRTWSRSRNFGVTMAEVKRRRHAAYVASLTAPPPEAFTPLEWDPLTPTNLELSPP
jgi:hypothetical protein